MQKLKDFKKNGYLRIENFYLNEIIESLSKRCAEIIYINPYNKNFISNAKKKSVRIVKVNF